MPVDVVILGATAVLAVVAVIAAVVAVRASRRAAQAPPASEVPAVRTEAPAVDRPAPLAAPGAVVVTRPEPVAHVVQGRVVVPPTAEQVASAALTRPSVRFSVLLHGVAHALRPESRDRISGLVRRTYRERRRSRLRAGRRAVREARPTPPGERWLGELPAAGEVAEP